MTLRDRQAKEKCENVGRKWLGVTDKPAKSAKKSVEKTPAQPTSQQKIRKGRSKRSRRDRQSSGKCEKVGQKWPCVTDNPAESAKKSVKKTPARPTSQQKTINRKIRSRKEEIIIELKRQLIQEKQQLDKIAEKLRKEVENVPEGHLRIDARNGHVQFYHCKEGGLQSGVYIHAEEINLAKQLAQKSYNEKVLNYAEKTANQIKRLLKSYGDNKLEEIYLAQHPERQKLVVPVEPTLSQEIESWLAIPYKGKGFSEDTPVILTNNGIRVRSKSEKIIADYLETMGIEYKYECPINLKPYGMIYPDFTIMSHRTRKIIYWEHEGMMDNPEYARSAIQKIELYEKNGIFPGDNLILTFETSTTAISTELIKSLTKKYLK